MARFELATPSSRTRCAARLRYIPKINQVKLWSEWRDSNSRPPGPKPGALPDCATLRPCVLPFPSGTTVRHRVKYPGTSSFPDVRNAMPNYITSRSYIIFIRCLECNAELHHIPDHQRDSHTTSCMTIRILEGFTAPPEPTFSEPSGSAKRMASPHVTRARNPPSYSFPVGCPRHRTKVLAAVKARKSNNVKERDHCMNLAVRDLRL